MLSGLQRIFAACALGASIFFQSVPTFGQDIGGAHQDSTGQNSSSDMLARRDAHSALMTLLHQMRAIYTLAKPTLYEPESAFLLKLMDDVGQVQTDKPLSEQTFRGIARDYALLNMSIEIVSYEFSHQTGGEQEYPLGNIINGWLRENYEKIRQHIREGVNLLALVGGGGAFDAREALQDESSLTTMMVCSTMRGSASQNPDLLAEIAKSEVCPSPFLK